jgi:hypothetical protein
MASPEALLFSGLPGVSGRGRMAGSVLEKNEEK